MDRSATGIIIQARLSSTRLPGKVLLPFWKDRTILDLLIQRLKEEAPSLPIVMATTQNPADDALVEKCMAWNVPVFRGDEQDVLKRFLMAAEQYKFENVIRICSDNPFLVAESIQTLIRYVEQTPEELDYVSFCDSLGTPSIKTHWGLFAEYVRTGALRKASQLTAEPLYREHVTNYVYGHPDIFNVRLLNAPEQVFSRMDLRFTIDTETDFEVNRRLFETLYRNGDRITLNDLVLETDRNPDIIERMKQGINNFKK